MLGNSFSAFAANEDFLLVAKARGFISWASMKCPSGLVRITDQGALAVKLYDAMEWSEELESASNYAWDQAVKHASEKSTETMCRALTIMLPELIELNH